MQRSFMKWTMAGALVAVTAVTAGATPDPNSAVIRERIFNDCPSSILTTTNNYPSLISISEQELGCQGFANLHNWRFSEDGSTPAVFNNGDHFMFSAELVIDGTGNAEAGLQIAPWWSQDVDGRFNVRTTDGEIACFGGRLPFFSFTGNFGLHYVKGDVIGLEVHYDANGNTEADPATIEYVLDYGGIFSSGPLPFDEGNPDEDPPYGVWGILNDARAGGYVQVFLEPGNPEAGVTAEWRGIEFTNLDGPTPTIDSTWGQIKSQFKK